METMTVKLKELGETRKSQRLESWKNLFTDHIYMVLNRVNPGMKLEVNAVEFISKILILVLHEFVEEAPETISGVQAVMKKLFPSAWATFVVKNTDFKDLIDKPWAKKKSGKDDKSKESKIAALLVQKVKSIMKENSEKGVDDRVVCYIHSVLDEIANDILKWTSISINKFHSDRREISKSMLIAAIYTDRGLSELMEKLLPGADSDYCAIDVYQQPTPSTPATSDRKPTRPSLYDYDKICHKFEIDENSFLRDLSILVNVFKRRLERGLGEDGRQHINSIFGNINEIYELTFKIVRTIEECREMSQTQSMGAGLADFVEGNEFESYSTFMAIFKEPIESKINMLLKEKKYQAFFDEEDKISFTPDGQCMRMAFKYVLPLYLHSVAAHFDGYYHYVSLLIKASRPGTDRIQLQSFETHLKAVSTSINQLDLPPDPHKKYSRLKDDAQRAQHMSNIQKIQRSIEGWEGKVIGFMCTEFIREGNLYVVHQSPSVKDQIRRKTWSERHVFLFDHLLVIVKSLKSGSYKYKMQIKVQCCDIFDLEDDDDLKHAFRIRVESRQNSAENTDIFLFCKSAEEKHDWLTSILEMQTAGILHRLLDSYNREMEIRTSQVLPTPEQYRFAEPDTDDNINFEDYMRNSGIPVIKTGTLVKLVERLTYPAYSDNDYIKTFFMTYRTFCSPHDLFSLLVERFNVPIPLVLSSFETVQSPPPVGRSGGPLAGRFDTVQSHGLNSAYQEQAFMRFRREYQKPIQIKVFFAINHWVNHHFYDFSNDTSLLRKLKDFLSGKDGKSRLTNDHLKTCQKLLDNIARKEATENNEDSATLAIISEQSGSCEGETPTTKRKNGRTLVGNFPEILWHHAKKGDVENYDLMTLHPVEIGRQVTLLDFHLFSSIKPIELVGAVWTKKDRNDSPQLKRMVKHSNMLTYWITKSIVETECIDERVEMISRILEILYVLEQYNNFNGMIAFGAALGSAAIHRLNESKSRLNKEKQQWYDHFRKICWEDNRQIEVKKKLKSVNPPCVPFPGSLMTQLVFYEEQHRTFVDERDEQSKRLISFVKCRKVAEIIKGAQLYQAQQYMFRVEPSILQFFENLNPLNGFKDDEELTTYLYNQSCKIEPREGGSYKGKPKYHPEALKSPGVKIPTKSTSKNHSSSLKSPKSPSPMSIPPTSSSPDDSHFGIVDINPGQFPKYIGDSGRINQGFSADTPVQTPTGMIRRTPSGNAGRRIPLSPSNASGEGNHFSFPPQLKMSMSSSSVPSTSGCVFPTTMAPGAIVLTNPPVGRRRLPPMPPTNGTLTRKPLPPIPCEPSSSKCESNRSESPPKDSLTETIKLNKTNSPPKSPSVSLMVPLPKDETSSDATTDPNLSLYNSPPRPPKPSSLVNRTSTEESASSPPPLPPKTYKKGNTTVNGNRSS